jgi:hypothetical protein
MSNSSLNHPTVTDDSPAFELRGNRFKPLAWENMSDDVIAVFDFCKELIQTRKVSDSVFAHVVKHFGERGVVDLMATMSYYTLVCMSLNVDDYPLPDGVAPELAAAWGPHP